MPYKWDSIVIILINVFIEHLSRQTGGAELEYRNLGLLMNEKKTFIDKCIYLSMQNCSLIFVFTTESFSLYGLIAK